MFAAAPGSLWEKHGLLAASGRRRESAGPASLLPRPQRFRQALEEAGGYFAAFGQFLCGRADLLPGPYLSPLQSLRIQRQEGGSPSGVPELRDRIVQEQWLRSTPGSEIFAATYQDRSIIVEVFLPPENASNGSWREFERQVQQLRGTAEEAVARPEVLEQFREWLSLHADAERKRGMLRTLQEIPFPCQLRFPKLLTELQAGNCLLYERMEGIPLAEALAQEEGAAGALDRWAEAVLEEALLLSVLDADAQLANYLLLSEGGVGFQTVPALAPVPVEWHNELLQYLAAAVAGNSNRAMQMLARICAGSASYAAEQELLETLSALQPELRIQSRAAETVVALENYWRALGQTALHPPLFLHLFHRGLSVLGQAVPADHAPADVISESLWPVMGRLLQYRIGDVLSGEKGQEWLASSGLLLLTALRQTSLLLEQIRDNDLAIEIEPGPAERRGQKRNRRVASLIHSGIGLVLFLFSLRLAQQASGAVEIAATVAAAACAVAVFILVARIE